MVMQDAVTAWDIKPNREDTNQKFNMLCNVVPVEHPWTGDGYNKNVDQLEGSRNQYRFEKCKGLKRCKLYEYYCSREKYEEEEDLPSRKRQQNRRRKNANFTDVVTFQGYRIYMRRVKGNLNPYSEYAEVNQYGKQIIDSGGDGNPNTCDDDAPSNVLRRTRIDKENTLEDYAQMSDAVRIYVQYAEMDNCGQDTYDSADESPIMLVKEYSAAECNPDRFVIGYGGIGVPKYLGSNAKLSMIYYGGQLFSYIYDLDYVPQNLNNVYLADLGIYVTFVEVSDTNEYILTRNDLPNTGYFISETAELSTMVALPEIRQFEEDDKTGIYRTKETSLPSGVLSYDDWGEVPYFIAGDKVYSINGFFNRNDDDCDIPTMEELNNVVGKDWQEGVGCRSHNVIDTVKKIFVADTEIKTAYNEGVITGFARRGGRLAYVADGFLYVSGNGRLNGTFSPYFFAQSGDAVRGAFRLPSGVTDIREYNSSLIAIGPKQIYGIVSEDQLKTGVFVSSGDNEDGCYCPGSYFNDEGEMLIVRRGKVLESMQLTVSYGNGAISFEPSTGFFINGHIKACNNRTDKINIDATINHRYISIYNDDDTSDHYSKLLIYHKHYNCWVHWLINGARVVHVKDGIFLGDNVYVNKGRTWNWEEDDTKGKEIIENVSLYIGEEGLQTPKHIQYVKTAIGCHSVITSNSKRNIDLFYGGKHFERRNDITTTRYPRLLFRKEEDGVIETYTIGEKIYGYGKKVPYNLVSEISNYRNFDNLDTPILREMGEDIDYDSKLAVFASIKEPVNAEANVISISISARGLDNIQFGSFYIGYYQLDADFEDIENTHIDITPFADRTKSHDINDLNKGEYCDEVLAGSACDVTYDDDILPINP